MVLLITNRSFNITIENLIDWLDYYKTDWKRIGGEVMYNTKNYKIELNNESSDPIIGLDNADLKEIKNVFFWRWGFFDNILNQVFDEDESNLQLRPYKEIMTFALREIQRNNGFISYALSDKKGLSRSSTASPNKLKMLRLARKHNLFIPPTVIATSKKVLREFFQKHNGEIIMKPLSNSPVVINNLETFMLYTTSVNKDDIKTYPDQFIPTLFQAKISKVYEIRTFFLEDKTYSMAIFSQADPKTQTDFRKYNKERPNRTVPYKLPEDISNKLILLMKDLDLKTGSIDLIKSTDSKYYFLEVNPVGQFGMVSVPCNYYLENEIAKTFMRL